MTLEKLRMMAVAAVVADSEHSYPSAHDCSSIKEMFGQF